MNNTEDVTFLSYVECHVVLKYARKLQLSAIAALEKSLMSQKNWPYT